MFNSGDVCHRCIRDTCEGGATANSMIQTCLSVLQPILSHLPSASFTQLIETILTLTTMADSKVCAQLKLFKMNIIEFSYARVHLTHYMRRYYGDQQMLHCRQMFAHKLFMHYTIINRIFKIRICTRIG